MVGIGGGIVGCEAALYSAQTGKRVTIVEILDGVARDMYSINRLHLLELLSDAEVEVLTETRVLELTEKGVLVADKDNKRRTLAADTVVLAVGLRPEGELFEKIGEGVAEVYPIGDCTEPRKVINAIWEGFRRARLI